MNVDFKKLISLKLPFSMHYDPEQKNFELSVLGFLDVENQNIPNMPVEEVLDFCQWELDTRIESVYSKICQQKNQYLDDHKGE